MRTFRIRSKIKWHLFCMGIPLHFFTFNVYVGITLPIDRIEVIWLTTMRRFLVFCNKLSKQCFSTRRQIQLRTLPLNRRSYWHLTFRFIFQIILDISIFWPWGCRFRFLPMTSDVAECRFSDFSIHQFHSVSELHWFFPWIILMAGI